MSRKLPSYTVCYPKSAKTQVDQSLYARLSESGRKNIVKRLTVAKKTGLAWEVKAGQTCRIITSYGSQVGDVNFWNLNNFRERFFSGKTRQLHRTHLTTYDRLWSSLPHLRPMATITQDSLQYGFDEDGMSVHDVIGTRCDPYTNKLLTGELSANSCHQNITEAIKPWGLGEEDVHDVFNIFMCTGFDHGTNEYTVRASPARSGDYIEWFAEMDLLVALSACPYGDVSIPVGIPVPDDICFPLDVEIGQPDDDVINQWKSKV